MKKNGLTILSIGLTAAGIILNLIQGIIDEKKLEEDIAEEVTRQISNKEKHYGRYPWGSGKE